MTKTKKKATTFKQLVASVREDRRKRGSASVTIKQLAKECGVSRAYFYFLMAGTKHAQEPVIERIATAFNRADSTVRRALAESRRRS